MVRTLLAVLPLAVLIGCAASGRDATTNANASPAAGSMTAGEKDALTLLVLGPKPNPVKACASDSLALNRQAVQIKLRKAPEQPLEAALRKRRGRTAALVQAQIGDWKRDGSPARLSAVDFDSCMAENGAATRLGALGQACFSVAEVAARVDVYKAQGLRQDKALTELRKVFGGVLSDQWLEGVNKEWYGEGTRAFATFHQQMFIKCVRSTP